MLTHSEPFSCKSSSIIYLLTCSCGIQYVGLTEQRLNERMNGHRASVKAGKSSFLYDHFNNPGHNFHEASIQIIDFIDPTSTENPRLALADRELLWINLLSTAHPLGLNDNIKGSGNISKSNFNNIYFKSKIKRYKRGHGRKKKNKSHENRIYKRTLTLREIDNKYESLKRKMSENKYSFYISSLQLAAFKKASSSNLVLIPSVNLEPFSWLYNLTLAKTALLLLISPLLIASLSLFTIVLKYLINSE